MNENYQTHVRPVTDLPTNNNSQSVTGLIKQLANDITSLFTKELALAKVEVSHSIQDAKTGAISMLTGGSIIFAGALFLLLAAVLFLGDFMPLWAASLAVGGVVAIIGLVMVMSGKKKLQASSFTPQHTLDAMEKDRREVRRAI